MAPETIRRPQRSRDGAKLGAARQQSILAILSKGEIISVADLAARFGVSLETVRRDFRALEEAGGLQRIHGGAAPMGTANLTARRPVSDRLQLDRDAKVIAAQAALPLFEMGMNIFLGGSSTTLLLATELSRKGLSISVTTNMIDIATILSKAGGSKVTLLGGELKTTTRTLVGYDTLKALERRTFDLAVCGASAIDAKHGFLGPLEWHGAVGAALAARSHRLAFVADASKFGQHDAHVVQPLDGVYALATDRLPPGDIEAALDANNVRLLLPVSTEKPRRPRSRDRS